tara:strand:+ start:72 stop:374 length:303 start_codon:yes stop_codon:yes gene_type:complete
MSLSELICEHMITTCRVESEISNQLTSIISRMPECDWEQQYILGEGEYKSLDVYQWVNDLMRDTRDDCNDEAYNNEDDIYRDISLIAEQFVRDQVQQLSP